MARTSARRSRSFGSCCRGLTYESCGIDTYTSEALYLDSDTCEQLLALAARCGTKSVLREHLTMPDLERRARDAAVAVSLATNEGRAGVKAELEACRATRAGSSTLPGIQPKRASQLERYIGELKRRRAD